MKLYELVVMATELDKDFNDKMMYWLKRKKIPELQYLIDHCSRILGSDFVEEQARKHLRAMDDAEEENEGV